MSQKKGRIRKRTDYMVTSVFEEVDVTEMSKQERLDLCARKSQEVGFLNITERFENEDSPQVRWLYAFWYKGIRRVVFDE